MTLTRDFFVRVTVLEMVSDTIGQDHERVIIKERGQ